MTRLVERVGLSTLIATTVTVVVMVVAATVLWTGALEEDRYQITARFTATPGLYADNDVDILGVPSGRIESVTPRAGHVDVVLSLPVSVKVPAAAKAVVMAPNPVSDRFVELTPPYTGGARLTDGAVIDLSDTLVPLELDSIFSNLSRLSRQLGPRGANNKGQVSAVLHEFARLADGNGAELNRTITSIAAALPALTRNPGQLKRLVTGLDSLTRKLAQRNSTINAFYDDLTEVTAQFADERATIAAAVANLQRGLERTSQFLRANRAHITGSVRNLDTLLRSIVAQQRSLIQTFDVAALGFTNFNRSVEPDGTCLSPDGAPNTCPALFTRINTTSDAWTFVQKYCGSSVVNALIPILLANAKLAKATATHTACGAQVGLLQKRTGPPGAPRTPDLGLERFLNR